ncbi:Transcription initiation factor IIB [Orchesella cincta]|uniref:Transcription initiation factor IIB n=1 Tax=Orchesella cincta TaxID=48709 RepID=A0A1D2M8I1_ORCCI|nr:Transcription initiation factor IIB [Orchesella cincta]
MSRADFTQAQSSNHPEAPLVEDCKAGDQICGSLILDQNGRTFSNEAAGTDACRVGGAENPLLNGSDLTRHIEEEGEISQKADRLALPKQLWTKRPLYLRMIRDGKKLKGRPPMQSYLPAFILLPVRKEFPKLSKKSVVFLDSPRTKLVVRVQARPIIINISVEANTTGDFMSRFCSLLGFQTLFGMLGLQLRKCRRFGDCFTGRSPLSVCSWLLYGFTGIKFKRSPKEISKVAGVSDVIVRQVYKLMYSRAGELFPKDFVFFTPIDMLPVA